MNIGWGLIPLTHLSHITYYLYCITSILSVSPNVIPMTTPETAYKVGYLSES
jgi:hypothetical protein